MSPPSGMTTPMVVPPGCIVPPWRLEGGGLPPGWISMGHMPPLQCLLPLPRFIGEPPCSTYEKGVLRYDIHCVFHTPRDGYNPERPVHIPTRTTISKCWMCVSWPPISWIISIWDPPKIGVAYLGYFGCPFVGSHSNQYPPES